MAKGAASKSELFAKIKEVYPESFWEDEGKILRVPMSEAGERVEIKVTLTAAKTNLGGDSAPSAFGSAEVPKNFSMPAPETSQVAPAVTEMTQEEKDNVKKMIAALGL